MSSVNQVTSELQTPRREPGGRHRLWTATQHFRPVLILLALLVVILSITQSNFLTGPNIQNVLTSVAVPWIVAMGMTFVLISGGFDLSVGATSALAGYAMGKLLSIGVPGAATLLVTIAIGAL